MRPILFVATFALLALGIVQCKKNNPAPSVNTAACTTCDTTLVSHTVDADSISYFLPSAFTPNGDGINDLFMVVYYNLDTDSSIVTIWDMGGTKVFDGKITQRWDGRDLNGAKCAAGKYPLSVYFKPKAGASFSRCACVTLLAYTGSCIQTSGITYRFPDQIDPFLGFQYPTFEQLCP